MTHNCIKYIYLVPQCSQAVMGNTTKMIHVMAPILYLLIYVQIMLILPYKYLVSQKN